MGGGGGGGGAIANDFNGGTEGFFAFANDFKRGLTPEQNYPFFHFIYKSFKNDEKQKKYMKSFTISLDN